MIPRSMVKTWTREAVKPIARSRKPKIIGRKPPGVIRVDMAKSFIVAGFQNLAIETRNITHDMQDSAI